MLRPGPKFPLPEDEISEEFVRASGPGGQNVNKVSTAVELRFRIAGSAALPEPMRVRLMRLAGRRVTKDGVLVIRADRFRTQEQNRADARQRLQELLDAAAREPKSRIKTRPTRASKERRLEKKARRSDVKRHRGKRVLQDD